MSDFLRQYEPIPELHELDPGYEAGWHGDVLILQALPREKTKGGLILAEQTKDDETIASVEARIIDFGPLAFLDADWPSDRSPPYAKGDIVLTRKFPAGLKFEGRDGRSYMMTKDSEIVGRRDNNPPR